MTSAIRPIQEDQIILRLNISRRRIPESRQIELDGIAMDVTFKDIRTIRLTVRPPDGAVRISAPRQVSIDYVLDFARSRLDWIKTHQVKQRSRAWEPIPTHTDGELHFLWGKPCVLKVEEAASRFGAVQAGNDIVLRTRPGSDQATREALLVALYREQTKSEIPALIAKWEPLLNVSVNQFYVQKMKTRWGSCNINAGTIRLNSELAKRPPACLEYVVVHEMVHLLERYHNARFYGFMDQFLPHWKEVKMELNGPLMWNHDDGSPLRA